MVNKTINDVAINVKFDEHNNHNDNLVSKESLQISLGKIQKWKTDFHSCVWNGDASTVNNHTVLSDVPVNAVFTDTIYTLPIATDETLGGVIIGDGIDVDENGIISVDIPVVDDDLVHGYGITNLVSITQAAYDALEEPDANTLYFIIQGE